MKNKKPTLKQRLENELKRTYHNATLHGKLRTESDYEGDLVEQELQFRIEDAFENLPDSCPLISKYAPIYSWGRGGRTIAPSYFVHRCGGSRFRIKEVEDFEPDQYAELYKALKELNDYVKQFCETQPDQVIEYIRGTYAKEIEQNKNKKRVVRQVIEYK